MLSQVSKGQLKRNWPQRRCWQWGIDRAEEPIWPCKLPWKGRKETGASGSIKQTASRLKSLMVVTTPSPSEWERTPDSLTGPRVKINTTCSDQTPQYLMRGKCFKRLLKSMGHEKGRYKSFFVFCRLFDLFFFLQKCPEDRLYFLSKTSPKNPCRQMCLMYFKEIKGDTFNKHVLINAATTSWTKGVNDVILIFENEKNT